MSSTLLSRDQFHVLHDLPGRCRLRFSHPSFIKISNTELSQRFEAYDFIKALEFNNACSSVVIQYVGTVEILFIRLNELLNSNNQCKKIAIRPSKLLPSLKDLRPLHSLAISGTALILGLGAGPIISIGITISAIIVRGERRQTESCENGLFDNDCVTLLVYFYCI